MDREFLVVLVPQAYDDTVPIKSFSTEQLAFSSPRPILYEDLPSHCTINSVVEILIFSLKSE
ncbi:hypothetical protein SCG7086_BL_00030 [Chlamydiales bacterium SCGC AG-110-P3]|nr:hypothetical protein SCG7086_BL_00030 [Chlamydiales bacterium SCGC AG-110-P3]